VVRGLALRRRRAAAAAALARFDPIQIESAVPVLVEVLRETAADLGPRASSVCLTLGPAAAGVPRPDDSVSALTRALDSEPEFRRTNAALALAQFGPRAREAAPRLRALATEDKQRLVRDAAASALEAIGEAAVRPGPD
jgi:HEAT repeat protein